MASGPLLPHFSQSLCAPFPPSIPIPPSFLNSLAQMFIPFLLLLPSFFLFLPLIKLAEPNEQLISALERRDLLGANIDRVPTAIEGVPTRVRIQMYIEGMSSFRSQSMELIWDGEDLSGIKFSVGCQHWPSADDISCSISYSVTENGHAKPILDFHLDLYFQEQWVDPRLAHNRSAADGGGGRILIKDPRLLDQFWHPDLYFANARTADFHQVTSPNFLVWIYPNGTVWYDLRVSLTVICTLNLVHYPFDSQSCTLRILSYAYDVDQLMIEWGGPVEKNPEILFPDMRLRKIVPRIRNDSYATGVWSCATAEFVLDRELVHHLIQSFIPSSLIVIVSWFNFWLDVECVPGRVSLSITTLLTLATQNSAERMTLPESGYVKASDIFSGACMAFVFSAMIEFTIVNYFTRRKHSWEKCPSGGGEMGEMSGTVRNFLDDNGMLKRNGVLTQFVFVEGQNNGSPISIRHELVENGKSAKMVATVPPQTPKAERKKSVARKRLENRLKRVQINRKAAQTIDQGCRLYFPLAFLFFNAFYWTYYLLIAKDQF